MLTFVLGTRPESVKLQPIVAELTRLGVPWQAIVTDQHTDLLVLDPVVWPEEQLIRVEADHPTDPFKHTALLQDAIVTECLRATLVIIQGDTTTALAGACAATNLDLPIGHVEAGIRSHEMDCPYPEEAFRIAITNLTDHHYAASVGNVENLWREGVPRDHIHLTGNPGLDHLRDLPRPLLPHPRCLVTLHRRESHGAPLEQILQQLAIAAARHPAIEFLWPVHPHPAVRHAALHAALPPNVYKLPPLPPEVFTQLLASATAVLTDSGGVQEEAAFLGIPCVVARRVTDRPESVASGHTLLAPLGTEVADPLHEAITFGCKASRFEGFGTGDSGPRIAAHLASLVAHPASQPTPIHAT